jgi:glycosyltransferase involved in cell wall biosynthesis
MQVRLLVIGDGPDMPRLQSMSGSCVEFLGRQQDEQVADLASRCRALLFPGEEDFGMTPLEVNAAGRPVIAFRGGGAVETVIPGLNGIFFEEPSVDSLVEALKAFERIDWEPARIRAHALGFDREVFQRRMVQFITDVLLQLHAGLPIETRLPAYAAEKFDTLKARS